MLASMTSDYATGTGCPEPYLHRIAEAGFTHTHWCHQWCTDFLYSTSEIDQIAAWLKAYGVQLLDLHASHGMEKGWVSEREYERLSGLELVANRIEMTARLGADVIILHIPTEPEEASCAQAFRERLWRSIDNLLPLLGNCGVRVAFENMSHDNFPLLREVAARFSADRVGICYDAGHGNIGDNDGLGDLESLKDRLISVHLHDNDGTGDQHLPLFDGTIDWPRLARIIASSSYSKPPNLESAIRASAYEDEREFLRHAYEGAQRFAKMLETERAAHQETTKRDK
ncbi:MAG: sugar phosphate isomerase/epimerase [Lentisphaeria bacterium]|nr:sugar phosphate isomerase/epimerase [Lentisphaeria bacterium]